MGERTRRVFRMALVGCGGAALAACIPQGAGPRSAEPRYTLPSAQPSRVDRVRQAPPPPPVRDTRRTGAERRPVASSTYIVRPGDTLDRIADRTGADAGAIIRANDMVSPYVVHPGQSLLIPGGRSYDPPPPR